MQVIEPLVSTLVAAAIAGVLGTVVSNSVVAGNLTRCDQARLAAHDAIIDAYGGILAELDDRIARARADRVDLAAYPYRDRDGRLRSVDIAGLRNDLERQMEKDAGGADRKIARDCGNEAPQDAAKTADGMAARGLSAIFATDMTNSGWPGDLFGSKP